MAQFEDKEYIITEAAMQVFLEKGLEGAKMQDIADRANISRTSLNYYYRTKENLFQELANKIFSSLLPRVEALSFLKEDVRSIVDSIVDIYFDFLRENESMPRFIFVEIQRNPQLIYDFVKQSEKAQHYLGIVSHLVESEMEKGKMRRMPMNQVICVFAGLVFAPFLINPLLKMYWDENETIKEQYFDDHKEVVKKLMRSYFND